MKILSIFSELVGLYPRIRDAFVSAEPIVVEFIAIIKEVDAKITAPKS